MNETFIKERILQVYRECRINSFPVDCFLLLRHYGFIVYEYDKIQKTNLELYTAIRKYSDDAFRYKKQIYYNSSRNQCRIRFSLMHELGHYILGHKGQNQANEEEADFFAINILAPKIVIYKNMYHSADELHNQFFISYAAANRILSDYRLRCLSEIDKQIGDWFFSPASGPEAVFAPMVPASSKKIGQTRPSKRSWAETEERIAFLSKLDPEYFFRSGEHQKLYGNDL